MTGVAEDINNLREDMLNQARKSEEKKTIFSKNWKSIYISSISKLKSDITEDIDHKMATNNTNLINLLAE